MSTFVLIEKYTVGAGGASSVTLGSGGTLPQTFTDLKLVISARGDVSSGAYVNDISVKLNNNTGANYSYRGLTGTNGGTSSFALSNETIFTYIAFANSSNSTASSFGSSELYFPNYTGSNYKSVSVDAISENNGAIQYMRLNAGIWAQTAAINRIDLNIVGGNFVQYSTFYLYGILKA